METINLYSISIIIITYTLSFFIFKKNNIHYVTFNLIFFWHLLFCIIYYYYSLNNLPTDSYRNYIHSLESYHDFQLGSFIVINFTRIFSYQLNFSYFDCFLIFNFIGIMGILFFLKSLIIVNNNFNILNKILFYIIIFLPSMYFWSTAIGKDAISFLAISIFIWTSLNFKELKIYTIISIFLMFIVRPHIASIMCFSTIIAIIFLKNFSLKTKSLYLFFLMIILFNITNYALTYVGMPNLINYYPFEINFNILFDFINLREKSYLSASAGVEISNMNALMKFFTYLYRPLPFETNNYFQLFVSLENTVLILITVIGILGIILTKNKRIENQSIILLLIYIIITLTILSFTSANFGIISRQKWMIFPAILVLLFQFSPINKSVTNGIKSNKKNI